MKPILCQFCKQTNETNHNICKEFYKFVILEKVKKTKKLLEYLLDELETL